MTQSVSGTYHLSNDICISNPTYDELLFEHCHTFQERKIITKSNKIIARNDSLHHSLEENASVKCLWCIAYQHVMLSDVNLHWTPRIERYCRDYKTNWPIRKVYLIRGQKGH